MPLKELLPQRVKGVQESVRVWALAG